jgi:hypothetical protein
MTDTYTLKEAKRVQDISSQYFGKWYVEVEENAYCFLNRDGIVRNCGDDDIDMDDFYFESRFSADGAVYNYIMDAANTVTVSIQVTGDVVESQPMVFE